MRPSLAGVDGSGHLAIREPDEDDIPRRLGRDRQDRVTGQEIDAVRSRIQAEIDGTRDPLAGDVDDCERAAAGPSAAVVGGYCPSSVVGHDQFVRTDACGQRSEDPARSEIKEGDVVPGLVQNKQRPLKAFGSLCHKLANGGREEHRAPA